MKRLIVLSLVLLTGCTAARETPRTIPAPELITVSSLPGCTSGSLTGEIQIDVVFEVARDGNIMGIRLIHTSGDPIWDRCAVEVMKQWRFAPVPFLDDSSTLAVRTHVNVRPEEPVAVPLGSLSVSTLAEAEMLHTLLRSGASFDSLAATARWDSPEKRGRNLGVTDIGTFPYHIRQELRALRAGKTTSPLRLGPAYVIFKRFTLPL